ncbi:MAG: DNA mismatch repair endonuclease MutL [Clostridia bacterium]|nr:DNA mismatch repair endonuclease MutL [Clostridia bacterium]
MGDIVLLDDLTINQIAAGEVIERPANVVKELVENSVDAGASQIVVEVKKGGKSFIKVSDNGKGINIDDVPFAIERHATSKIRKIEDLENTYTMGFRGEALASIAAISKLTITSKTEDNRLGARVIAEGGEIIQASEFACAHGTIMQVENLFFNTPVRYKFLKNDGTEYRYIKELIQLIALANPDVSIKLIGDGRVSFQTNGNGKLEDIIYTLYGRNVYDNLVKVDYVDYNIRVTGVVGNSYMAKENRKEQISFLNKRPIKNPILIKAADQAFKGSIGIGKFGFYVLNIEMPANCYDVNVHPTKQEVRFKDEDFVYKAFYRSIKTSILDKAFLGNEEAASKREDYVNDELSFLTSNYESKDRNKGYNFYGKNIIEKDLNQDVKHEDIIIRDNKRKVEFRYLGILFKTYIVIEVENELYLIDQHAAHERLLYEQIKANYKNNLKNDTQMTLIPEIIDLTHKEMEFVRKNEELIRNVGYEFDFFGDNSIKLNGVPDIEYREKTNIKDAFMDVLDEMITNSRSPIKDIEERFIATVACKAAVKAGMDIGIKEVDYLINNLLILQNPYTCPHGRPTTIKFNKEDFEKLNI